MTICGRAMSLVQWTMACWLGVAVAAMAQTEAPQFPFPPSPVEGVWRAQLESEVTIQACELGYCGFLTKIVVPSEGLSAEELAAAAAMSPEQFFDYRNEDPTLRNRPMQDLHLLTLRPGDKPAIFDGEIYNPQDGKTYSGYVELTGPDRYGSMAACSTMSSAAVKTGCGCRRPSSMRGWRKNRRHSKAASPCPLGRGGKAERPSLAISGRAG